MPRPLCYIDTSTFMRAIMPEAGQTSARDRITRMLDDGYTLVASELLEAEAHRVRTFKQLQAHVEIRPADLERALGAVTLVSIERDDVVQASQFPFHIRTLDALHLATALRLNCTHLLTDDQSRASSMKQVAEERLGMVTV